MALIGLLFRASFGEPDWIHVSYLPNLKSVFNHNVLLLLRIAAIMSRLPCWIS